MEEAKTMTDVSRVPQPVGPRIEVARHKAGMTQEELAARIGVKLESVQAWEAGARAPRVNRLVTLAGLLGVSLPWLLEGREDRHMESAGELTVTSLSAQVGRLRAMLAEALALAEDLEARVADAARDDGGRHD